MKRGGMRTPTIFLRKNRRGAGWNKKAQVTIFIILAIIIVALAFLIYSFYPEIKSTLGAGEKSPQSFIQSCIEDDIRDTVDKVSLQGGILEPEGFFVYNNIKIEYLCYTDKDVTPCVVQEPLLKSKIESEIKKGIENSVDSCFNSLKQSYEKRGYNTYLVGGEIKIELLPKRIVSTFNYSLSLTKGDTQRYDSFVVMLDNNLYELVAIANSIIEWEYSYGYADPTFYMTYYKDLKVEKKQRDDGTNIYIITDRNTKDKFQFASRSFVIAPGF